tara:strand:- start:49 stop:1056 length:1008 start_codon:yes stop_codon:yes gene_type:complete
MGNVLNLGTGDFTIAFWAKRDNWGLDSNGYLISKHEDTDNRWYIRIKNDDPPRLQLYTKIGGSDSGKNSWYGDNTVGPSFDDLNGQWVHLCISSDRDGQNKGYINGVLNDSDSGSTATMDNDGPLEIAKWNNTEFPGSISEAVIYNKALSTSEVKAIYNDREPYNHNEGVASSNLQAWWRMGDGRLDEFNLICDEKTPTIGSDLITNGGFDSASGWTVDNFSIGSGVATTSTNGASIEQSISISAGDVIKIVAEIKSYSSGSIRFYTGNGSDNYRSFSSDGVHTHYLIANNTKVLFYSDNFNGSLDNVKVYKVNGYPGTMINMAVDDIEGDSHGA